MKKSSVAMLSGSLTASELPRLAKELAPEKQTYSAQKDLPDLTEPYVSTSPEDLDDGLRAGTLDLPGFVFVDSSEVLLSSFPLRLGVSARVFSSLGSRCPDECHVAHLDQWVCAHHKTMGIRR